jgi:hypothetical protein
VGFFSSSVPSDLAGTSGLAPSPVASEEAAPSDWASASSKLRVAAALLPAEPLDVAVAVELAAPRRVVGPFAPAFGGPPLATGSQFPTPPSSSSAGAEVGVELPVEVLAVFPEDGVLFVVEFALELGEADPELPADAEDRAPAAPEPLFFGVSERTDPRPELFEAASLLAPE